MENNNTCVWVKASATPGKYVLPDERNDCKRKYAARYPENPDDLKLLTRSEIFFEAEKRDIEFLQPSPQQSAPASGKGEILGYFDYDREKQTATYTPVSGKEVGEVKSGEHTLGKLISGSMVKNMVNSVPDIPADVFEQLKTDCYYPNSIPVIFMRNMLRLLDIPVDEAIPAMFATYDELQVKGIRHHGHGLWENKEALSKYASRLKELMRSKFAAQFQGQQSAISNVEDKMEVLEKIVMGFTCYNYRSYSEEGKQSILAVFRHYARADNEAQSLISQLFSNSEPVSNLLADMQVLRERLEAAEKFIDSLDTTCFIAGGERWQLLTNWQQLKHQSKTT